MKKQVYILGGGISGLTLAVQFLRRFGNKCSVTVIEGSENIGGIAGSFHVDGLTFDYGSHRIHPATPAHIFSDIKAYLGNDLLERPRNGRIRLLETYIPFPLRPAEMLRNLPYRFTAGFIFDLLKKALGSKQIAPSNFADALRQDLGNTICENFYFPFARKLWGVEPSEIAPVQARRRVAAQGMVALIKKAFCNTNSTKNFFYYPRKGFGQLADALAEECRKLGGVILTSTQIKSINTERGRITGICIGTPSPQSYDTDMVFSTIPVSALVNLLLPPVVPPIRTAVDSLRYRSLVLLYMVLDTDRFTPYDAHYFAQPDVIFSRVSESKNYTDSPCSSKTGICLEIPCFYNDDVWNADSQTLGKQALDDLEKAGMPVACRIEQVFKKSVRYAYPLYERNYGWNMTIINTFLEGITNLICLGRHGLFLHDNIHHDMDMAYTAVSCVQNDCSFDTGRWLGQLPRFKDQVVED